MQDKLPIAAYKDEIIETVLANQVTIVEGETGSGKTTHIPVYLLESKEIVGGGMIGVTEPRRVAAKSVAKYVAQMLKCKLGEEVAYQVRFDNNTSDKTKVKFMTDGILLREIQLGSDLSQYSVIIVDEAHERSVNIDLTIGLLKKTLKTRPDLRVIITSATIDTAKFSRYFADAPVISIPGRCHQVEVMYRPLAHADDEFGHAKEAARLVREIHETREAGDLLVFMSGMDDILVCVKELERMRVPGLLVLIAHRDMAAEDEDKIFMDFPHIRKVVVGTNIIETGITVVGAKYGIDSGYIKLTDYEPISGLSSLKRGKHSKSGCNQRSGRMGRTQPGYCWRLYDPEDYQSRPSYTKPEILRTELAGLVLLMKSIGIDDVDGFEFVDNPGRDAIRAAHETLINLGAIKLGDGLTENGRLMAKLPVEPRSARMIVEAIKRGCVDQILTVVAFRSSQSVFVRPRGKEREADLAKAALRVPSSDYLTWLNIYRAFNANHQSRRWAESQFLKGRVLSEIGEIREQLIAILDEAHIPISTSDNHVEIAKCVTAGLVENVCHKLGSGFKYQSGSRRLQIFPGSALRTSCPPLFVCNDVRDNGNATYGIDCQTITAQWLIDVAPQLCRVEPIVETIRYHKKSRTYQASGRIEFANRVSIGEQQMSIACTDPRFAEVKSLYDATHRRNGRRKGKSKRKYLGPRKGKKETWYLD